MQLLLFWTNVNNISKPLTWLTLPWQLFLKLECNVFCSLSDIRSLIAYFCLLLAYAPSLIWPAYTNWVNFVMVTAFVYLWRTLEQWYGALTLLNLFLFPAWFAVFAPRWCINFCYNISLRTSLLLPLLLWCHYFVNFVAVAAVEHWHR